VYEYGCAYIYVPYLSLLHNQQARKEEAKRQSDGESNMNKGNSEISEDLPRCVVHGDFNASNVVCTPGTDTVAGCIDVGDAVYTFRVCDVAIALAYAMLLRKIPREGFWGADAEVKDEKQGDMCCHALKGVFKGYRVCG
jgi:Ser/Thr protein kinase RdoA (MazF antagonist)